MGTEGGNSEVSGVATHVAKSMAWYFSKNGNVVADQADFDQPLDEYLELCGGQFSQKARLKYVQTILDREHQHDTSRSVDLASIEEHLFKALCHKTLAIMATVIMATRQRAGRLDAEIL